ncbi:MAG: aldehyde dehydrogenase family protein [Anaerolineae bacterium]
MSALRQPTSTPTSAASTATPESRLIESFNPATGAKIGEVRVTPLDDMSAIMARARAAQPAWEKRGLAARLQQLRQLKTAYYLNRDRIVETVTQEQGKPPLESLTYEFWPVIDLISYYLRNGKRILAPSPRYEIKNPLRYQQVEHRAHGVVLVISPWNFPMLLPGSPIVAALLAGNSVIFKPSEFTPLCGQLLAEIIWEAGIPRDVLQIVQGYGDVAAAAIQQKPDKICFTGSVATGKKVALAAGEQLIPVTLELGGKDAAIVLEDADLDTAARGIAWSGLLNGGQACAGVERTFVMRSVYDAFLGKLQQEIKQHVDLQSTDGKPITTPITTGAQLKIIDGQVREAVEQGATVLLGGHVAQTTEGRYYEPTVITNVKSEMKIMTAETFGPVIAVVPIDDDAEAIRRANETNFGLVASIWTRDRERGLEIARQLKAGHASLNDHLISAFMPSMPWGGVGDTGYGRTRGEEGLRDMTRPMGIAYDLLSVPVFEQLIWYPHTPAKLDLMKRLLGVLYAPGLLAKLKALLGRDN